MNLFQSATPLPTAPKPTASLVRRGCSLIATPRATYSDGALRSIYRILMGCETDRTTPAIDVQVMAGTGTAGWERFGRVLSSLPAGWESSPISCADVRGDDPGSPCACDGCQLCTHIGSPLDIDAAALEALPSEIRRRHNPARSTDLGNAERLIEYAGDRLRYCRELGWLVWDGRRWAPDGKAAREVYRKAVVPGIYREVGEAAAKHDGGMVKALVSWALKSEANAKAEAALAMAESDERIYIPQARLNRDKMLLNVRNGTIDLRTGRLRPHDQKDLITHLAGATFDAAATCPTWLKFLDRIFAGKKDLVGFVQRAIGYSLTGKTSEQAMLLCWGGGKNGKTVLTKTITNLLGTYGTETPAETLMARKQESGNTNDVARLAGARFVSANETEDGQRLAESKVKGLTGGDIVTARFLHREFFEFEPEFKLWLRTNHRPHIRGTDDGIWRRIRLVPFVVQIPEAERDPDLADKLLAELPGILNWALTGCLDWQRIGLAPTAEVMEATQEYRRKEDVIGSFLEAKTVTNHYSSVKFSDLYKAYTDWCEEAGERAAPQRIFSERLAERGIVTRRGGQGVRLIDGLRLVAYETEEAQYGDQTLPEDAPAEASASSTQSHERSGKEVTHVFGGFLDESPNKTQAGGLFQSAGDSGDRLSGYFSIDSLSRKKNLETESPESPNTRNKPAERISQVTDPETTTGSQPAKGVTIL